MRDWAQRRQQMALREEAAASMRGNKGKLAQATFSYSPAGRTDSAEAAAVSVGTGPDALVSQEARITVQQSNDGAAFNKDSRRFHTRKMCFDVCLRVLVRVRVRVSYAALSTQLQYR